MSDDDYCGYEVYDKVTRNIVAFPLASTDAEAIGLVENGFRNLTGLVLAHEDENGENWRVVKAWNGPMVAP